MTANTRFPCAVNPETGRPYTKHKHINRLMKFVKPTGPNYWLASDPFSFVKTEIAVTKQCARPGCKKYIQDWMTQ